MKIIGLTGGIGTGKSTVSRYLKERGLYIIDADEISRSVTAYGGPALGPIMEEFGPDVFISPEELDRKALADQVFTDPEKRKKLEDIVVTMVIDEFLRESEALREEGDTETVIFDAPLLYEFGLEKYCDETWLVSVPLEERIKRVTLRDGADPEDVKARIRNQMSQEEKEKRADVIIDNSGDHDNLYLQLDRLVDSL